MAAFWTGIPGSTCVSAMAADRRHICSAGSRAAARKRPWSPGELRPEGAFEERYRRFWFDTHLNSPRSEEFFITTVGRDRLVYGTNFVGWDAPDADSAHKPEPYLAENARRLLRVKRR